MIARGLQRGATLSVAARRWPPRTFTLVELMIVVAILGILSSIAIPAFATYQLRARKSEVLVNVPALRDAMVIYQMETGAWHYVLPVPRTTPDKQRVDWPATSDFDIIGWTPDGAVYGIYWSGNDGSACPAPTTTTGGIGAAPLAIGTTDLDGDGQVQHRVCCGVGATTYDGEGDGGESTGTCAFKYHDGLI